MSLEERRARAARVQLMPADKTDAPRGVRNDSVKNFATENFVNVKPATPLKEALALMQQDQDGCIIVCEGERVIGMLTESDVLTKIVNAQVGMHVDMNAPVGAVMASEVATLSSEATLGDVVRLMNERGLRNIPVVDGDRLVSAISVLDVITYLAESYPKETMNLPPVPTQVMETQEGG
ncbi:MAG: CBS domain-containing protein [Pyrinomonadaceae bacterium]|jgi:CBS domain-containing protein|nr:CBS domain-containing protein [Pyrinomonadaceae bacterium]